ncbi:hypothetical protein ACF0H5_008015 [Mactra antiquata]
MSTTSVGSSGRGKSFIAALMERFYEIDSGNVIIDGVDLKTLDPSWDEMSCYRIYQSGVLRVNRPMPKTIKNAYPDPGSVIFVRRGQLLVYEAATLANAYDFIDGFPEGYNTILGERGGTVSGDRQKHGIAIARALIKNPSILILDEATSELDAESERIVQLALDTVSRGCTVLVKSHRLSTIRDADIVVVVSHGQIVELGNHESLKKKKGLYWDLTQQQELEKKINIINITTNYWMI